MNYDGKFGTEDANDVDTLSDLLTYSDEPVLDNPDDILDDEILVVNLDEVNSESERQAKSITEKLSNYYFDEKYIEQHPYIPSKIAQSADNIRRLLKMLSVNEKAQDALIQAISHNSGKGTLFQSLTSLQNAMLSIQTQLNNLTSSLENIFKEMQDNCEKTFEEKDKEVADDGSVVARGSREFIKDISALINGKMTSDEVLKNIS